MFNTLKNKSLLFNPSSIIVALLLPTIILLRLPGIMIDGFILLSFISSALLLIIMLENTEPLKVTFLPTMVLLTTTFRLLLTIATTRNIIGNSDVGNIIETVGDFVMGGNLISGLLIFIIITIVQFLVVTKGSERVAEVGARFSLDAMPGRQMTIDGDLKSNLITPEQAQKMRADLSTENKLFGSLDGAMKFVKGDAIAGILISLVNLFGGIYVGTNQLNYTLFESVHRFSVLTIGDGLVSQIPSLLLSMACGVYLTRIKSIDETDSSFLNQLMTQISAYWKTLIIIAGILLAAGLLDPELLIICLIFTAICLLGAFALRRGNVGKKTESVADTGSGLYKSLKFKLREFEHQYLIHHRLAEVEHGLWDQKLGTPIISIDPSLENDIEVYISDILVYKFQATEPDHLIEIIGDDVFITDDDLAVNLDLIINYFLRKQLVEKYNIQYSSNIVDGLAEQSEVMKSEIDSAIGLNRVHDILKEMIRSPEFYLDQISFFEALIYWSRVDNDSNNWLIRIRTQAKYEITARLLNNSGKIHVVLLNPDLTEKIASIVTGQLEDIELQIKVQRALRNEILRITKQYRTKPALVVNDTEINLVKPFFRHVISTLPICSHGDIANQDCIASSEMLMVEV